MEFWQDCSDLMDEVWNPYGGARIEVLSASGAMKDRKGNTLPESLFTKGQEYFEFKVGIRSPIWCIWDGEKLYLTKYSTNYTPPSFAVPETKEEK